MSGEKASHAQVTPSVARRPVFPKITPLPKEVCKTHTKGKKGHCKFCRQCDALILLKDFIDIEHEARHWESAHDDEQNKVC
jgi:hypothetical protein